MLSFRSADFRRAWGAAQRLRTRLPLGILLIAAILMMLGGGSLLGSAFLLLRGDGVGYWAPVASLAFGSAALYLRYCLLRLVEWSWRALLFLLALLFLSSVLRLLAGPTLRVAPLLEIGAELVCAIYLTRPRVRALFAGGSRALEQGG